MQVVEEDQIRWKGLRLFFFRYLPGLLHSILVEMGSSEDMDMYCNVPYAKECFSTLSYLAHRVSLTNKYRPESCCIIGNYYSLKGQHEKSIVYFRRTLKLNKNYLSA